MKSETGGTKKQRKTGCSGGTKNPCGTLSYLAECRGNGGQKANSSRVSARPDGLNRIVRKHPADK